MLALLKFQASNWTEIFPRQILVPSKIFQSSFCEWACFQLWSPSVNTGNLGSQCEHGDRNDLIWFDLIFTSWKELPPPCRQAGVSGSEVGSEVGYSPNFTVFTDNNPLTYIPTSANLMQRVCDGWMNLLTSTSKSDIDQAKRMQMLIPCRACHSISRNTWKVAQK